MKSYYDKVETHSHYISKLFTGTTVRLDTGSRYKLKSDTDIRTYHSTILHEQRAKTYPTAIPTARRRHERVREHQR